ncbi:MAG: TRAP transporter small permease [Aeriscardovia sp.]|nr:TRAP transporter small permease [Aeriscardovia sp.]MBP3832691.1 TRAP transporter small permease [Bacteroidaceae bacterium]
MRGRISKIWDRLEESIMISLLCGMAVVMMIQICCRYIFSMSLSWSEEVTRYMFIWSAFMSISLCTKLTISIRIDAIIRLFSKKGRALVKIFNLSVELAFFLYLIPYAWHYLQSTIESGQVSPACGIPMYFIQSAPLVCFSLCCVRILERWFLQWHNYLHNSEYRNWAELRESMQGCFPSS